MPGNNHKKTANKSGFTLIEVLVVLGIFTLLVVMIINVFLLSLKSQREASARQDAVSNLRFVMETMAQDIRTQEIDYNENLSPNSLHLRFGQDTAVYSLGPSGEIILNLNGQDFFLTSSEEVVVFKMNFFVDPSTDPFAEERCNQHGDCGSGACTIDNPDASPDEFKAGFCTCEPETAEADCPLVKNCIAQGSRNLCLPFDVQPRVTITLAMQPVEAGAGQEPIYLQTTVSSRIYKR